MSWNTGTGEHFIASNPPTGTYGSKSNIVVAPTSVNLQVMGADMSGGTSSDAAWTAAKAALPTGGGQIYVPPGIVATPAGIVIPSGVSLLAAGSAHSFPEVRDAPVTLFKWTGGASAAAVVSTDTTKPYIGSLKGFAIDAQYLASISLKVLEAGGASFEDINGMHSTADGLLLQPTGALGGHLYLCDFNRVAMHDCNGNAARANGFSASAGAVTLNRFDNCRFSANGGTPVSFNYQQFADTNTHTGGRIEANVANMIGLLFNSQTPAADTGVYSNRLLGVSLDGTNLAGQTAIRQNENTTFVNLVIGSSFGGTWTTLLSTPNLSGATVGGAGIYINECSGFTPAKRAVTAGASVYTYKNQDGYQEMFMLTAVNGLTAMTYKTQAGASIAQGIPFILNPGDSVVLTWATTAPTFEILPVPVT